jgi:HD superfamily phosphohydrolase
MYLKYYLEQLRYSNMPSFLIKYLKTPCLLRLKKIAYFCGMDYASKNIYNFKEPISRYDHSLSVALLTYRLTNDKVQTLAGLFHDIATPCFSHVIDYMNKDYEKQESTEEYTEKILSKDNYLLLCLKEDNINLKDISDFKKYSIVDNERPKLCADRIDGVILTGISWTKNINKKDIHNIVNDLKVFINEDNQKEIGFNSINIAQKVVNVSKNIDLYCHSSADNYMMELLATITREAINNNYITYDALFTYTEEQLFNLLTNITDKKIVDLLYQFKNIKAEEIPKLEISHLKVRKLNPLVNNKRYETIK